MSSRDKVFVLGNHIPQEMIIDFKESETVPNGGDTGMANQEDLPGKNVNLMGDNDATVGVAKVP